MGDSWVELELDEMQARGCVWIRYRTYVTWTVLGTGLRRSVGDCWVDLVFI